MKRLSLYLFLFLLIISACSEQNQISKCKGTDSSKWTSCFGKEKIKKWVVSGDKMEHRHDGVYEGEYLNGKFNGQGTLTSENGDKYVGGWKDNKRHGLGTYMFANGNKYVGEWKDGVLHIRSKSRMLGYLNAPSPFDSSGWYDTKDVVDEKDGYYKVVGRTSDVINVGGLKFMASEVERVALGFPGVSFVKAYPMGNPITGQHVELILQTKENSPFDMDNYKIHLKNELQSHMVPMRIRRKEVNIGYRFKRI